MNKFHHSKEYYQQRKATKRADAKHREMLERVTKRAGISMSKYDILSMSAITELFNKYGDHNYVNNRRNNKS